LHWLDSGLHKREDKAITNFQITLSSLNLTWLIKH
jgi:hypothetical protein